MYEYDLSIIIVAWNVKELVDRCLSALEKSDDSLHKQILLVDNGSVDGTAEFVKRHFSYVNLIESPTNLGFIRANNLAYKYATGEYILMLNSDAFVFPDSIRKLFSFLKNTPDAGITGPRLIGLEGDLKPSLRFFPTPLRLFLLNMGFDGKFSRIKPINYLHSDPKTAKECDWVSGCCLLTKKELIEQTGFFLREEFFMYNDDNDLCKRINKLDYKTYYYPVDVIHLGGANMKKMHKRKKANPQIQKYQVESQMIYFRKNHGIGTVVLHLTFLMFFDWIVMLKRIAQLKGDVIINEILPHFRMVLSITLKTDYGRKPIH